MTVWFVSRHPGAKAWIENQGIAVDRWVEHLDPECVERGDVVLGTLPISLAAIVCERGARFFALTLDLPSNARGMELSSEMLCSLGGRLEEFRVVKAGGQPDFLPNS